MKELGRELALRMTACSVPVVLGCHPQVTWEFFTQF